MKSAVLAKTAKPGRARRAQMESRLAPMGGWHSAGNLDARPANTAERLENWRPTSTGMVQRGGNRKHATITDGTAPVVSFITYNATQKKLFAATQTKIYDLTTVADPSVIPASAAVSGQTSGYYSFVNFANSGSEYMTVVNGHDPLLLYDPVGGWKQITGVSTPAITGASTSVLSFVWVYRNRQFFIGPGLIAYCLPVGAIAGALVTIDLNGVFQRGGALTFGASWSLDAGDGLDDKCVFVSNAGEVAVYEGSNPADPNNWRIVGRYDMAEPLGPRAFVRSGGDLLIATEVGLLPVSKAVSEDVSSLELPSLSAAISPDWRREAVNRRALPWEIVKFPEMSYAMISLPGSTVSQKGLCYVINTETGAWCTYTGWDARCLAFHAGSIYFGTRDGKVFQGEVGGKDNGGPIYYTCVANPDDLGVPGILKTVLLSRYKFKAATPYFAVVSASTDNQVELATPPNPAPDSGLGTGFWDIGLWDQAKWDAAMAVASLQVETESIGRSGYNVQWHVQVTGAQTTYPVVEMVSIDLSFEVGAPVL